MICERATVSVVYGSVAFGREKPNPPRYGFAISFAPLIDGTPPYVDSAGTNITEEERMLIW